MFQGRVISGPKKPHQHLCERLDHYTSGKAPRDKIASQYLFVQERLTAPCSSKVPYGLSTEQKRNKRSSTDCGSCGAVVGQYPPGSDTATSWHSAEDDSTWERPPANCGACEITFFPWAIKPKLQYVEWLLISLLTTICD